MKYICTDGVDRDKAVDEYLELEKNIAFIEAQIKHYRSHLETTRNILFTLSFNSLGAIGLVAVANERLHRIQKKELPANLIV